MSICEKLRELQKELEEVHDWALGLPSSEWEKIHKLNPKIWDILLKHSTLLSVIEDLCGR